MHGWTIWWYTNIGKKQGGVVVKREWMCLLHLRGQGCSRQMGLALSVLPIIIFLTSSSSCRLLACFTDYHQWLTGGTLLNNGKQVHEKHTTVCSLSRWPKQKGSLIFVSTLYLLLCKVTLVFQIEDTVRLFGSLLLLDPIHFPKSEPCLIIGSVCQIGALLGTTLYV